MDNYLPLPIDTSRIELPPTLFPLLESLARNTHEVWAARRIKDGWTFGSARNDQTKKHPCLIPYAELPETEKAYDRNTAIETLKVVLALGYRIEL